MTFTAFAVIFFCIGPIEERDLPLIGNENSASRNGTTHHLELSQQKKNDQAQASARPSRGGEYKK